ncbi:hypothetical protein PATA110615_27440 [Paenibacillus taichungensis]
MQNKSLTKENHSIGKRSGKSRKHRHRVKSSKNYWGNIFKPEFIFKWTFKLLEYALVIAKLIDVIRNFRK